MVNLGAALAFVIGSVFFFMRLDLAVDWMFLVGSILFAVKPTIDVVRAAYRGSRTGRPTTLLSRSPDTRRTEL